MPAKNIECQLAQGQIGRYLAGAPMSDEAVAQLEGHIAECEDCTTFIDRKRSSLRELAANRKAAVYLPEEPAEAAAPEPTSPPAAPRNPAAKALIDAIREKSAGAKEAAPVVDTKREPGTPRVTHWKALAYSTGLGLVLYGMTFITSNPTALFGERAATESASSNSEALPTDPAATPVPAASKADGDPFTEDAPIEKPAGDAKTAESQKDGTESGVAAGTSTPPVSPTTAKTPSEPTVSQSSTPPRPRVSVKSQPVRRASRPVRRTSATGNRRPNSIRVYDESGRPINGG